MPLIAPSERFDQSSQATPWQTRARGAAPPQHRSIEGFWRDWRLRTWMAVSRPAMTWVGDRVEGSASRYQRSAGMRGMEGPT